MICAFMSLFILSLGFVNPSSRVMAEDDDKRTGDITLQSVTVNIESKRVDHLITDEGGPFLVNESSEIFDNLGGKITLEKLPVPCRAKIEHEPISKGDPLAYRINVVQTLPGATTAFPPPLPE